MTVLPEARRQAVWRASILLLILSLVIAACGGDAETSTTSAAGQTTTAAAATTTPPPTTAPPTTAATTTAPPTTSTPPAVFAVAGHGAGAVGPLPGSDGMLGSGCSPGATTLPDGIWFGWVEDASAAGLSFDLVCLRAGSPAKATNDNPQLRELAVATGLTVRNEDGVEASYANWDPRPSPVWIYVNGGIVTEVAEPTIPVSFETSTTEAWVEAAVALPVGGGCCGEMYNGPASPAGSWPATGLPADGVYGVEVSADLASDVAVLEIMRFVPCTERPEICNPDYLEGDVALDYDDRLTRVIPMDDNLTVELMGIHVDPALNPDTVRAVVGSGTAFADLLAANAAAFEQWIAPKLDAGAEYQEIYEDLRDRGAADPTFPYAASACCDADWSPLVYRGPLGVELVDWVSIPNSFLGPTQLEIRSGLPILIMDGGRIAG